MIIFTAMDYFIGFLFGFFCKAFWSYLGELSDIRVAEDSYWGEKWELDDLP